LTLTYPNSGSTASTASEATINEITSNDLQYWGAQVFIPSTTFTTGDVVELKFYGYAIAGTPSLEVVYYKKLTGALSYLETEINFPPTPCTRYRLTIKRLFGTDRTWRWQIVKQTG
jgi:hypothetical protein